MARQSSRIYCITCKKRIKEKDLRGVESDPSEYAGYQCAKCRGDHLKEIPPIPCAFCGAPMYRSMIGIDRVHPDNGCIFVEKREALNQIREDRKKKRKMTPETEKVLLELGIALLDKVNKDIEKKSNRTPETEKELLECQSE